MLCCKDELTSQKENDAAGSIRTGTLNTPLVQLESGTVLHNVAQRWTLIGTPNAARDNIVLVAHALTGTADVHQWWANIVGPGLALDTNHVAVLCANVLGGCSGSAGPRTGSSTPFPALTTRDQAEQLWRLLDAFNVRKPALVVGGSLGGMVALEVAALRPARVREVVVFAAPAAQTALGAGWHAIMRTAVQVGGAREGLALARMAGMLSYRSAAGFESRFGRATAECGTPAITQWLTHHGARLVERFDTASYVSLIDAMDRHDIGRSRGGVSRALRDAAPRVTGVGIPGDLLFPAEVVQQWTQETGARYSELTSLHGHDAFLLETEQVSGILQSALRRSEASKRSESRVALTHSAQLSDSPALLISSSRSPRSGAHTARVALAGCGTVGDALMALLARRSDQNRQPAFLTSVLVRDSSRHRRGLHDAVRNGLVSPRAVTCDPTSLLADSPDVLIEVLGGVEPARTLVESALRRGVRVITANKALIAAHGPALIALARAHGTTIDFEGTVGASIPVVRALRSGSAGHDIVRITGVLNGTTNVILDAVGSGATFDEALASAQANGFAEADPTRDLNGQDAEDKLRILAWLGFGVRPQSLEVDRRGLDAAVVRWTSAAAAHGDAIRLLASVERTDERSGTQLRAVIRPQRVRSESAWGNVRGAQNRIEIERRSGETLTLSGPGAGGHATALALLSDLQSPVQDSSAR